MQVLCWEVACLDRNEVIMETSGFWLDSTKRVLQFQPVLIYLFVYFKGCSPLILLLNFCWVIFLTRKKPPVHREIKFNVLKEGKKNKQIKSKRRDDFRFSASDSIVSSVELWRVEGQQIFVTIESSFSTFFLLTFFIQHCDCWELFFPF